MSTPHRGAPPTALRSVPATACGGRAETTLPCSRPRSAARSRRSWCSLTTVTAFSHQVGGPKSIATVGGSRASHRSLYGAISDARRCSWSCRFGPCLHDRDWPTSCGVRPRGTQQHGSEASDRRRAFRLPGAAARTRTTHAAPRSRWLRVATRLPSSAQSEGKRPLRPVSACVGGAHDETVAPGGEPLGVEEAVGAW